MDRIIGLFFLALVGCAPSAPEVKGEEVSTSSDKNKYLDIHTPLHIPFDTAKVIQMMDLQFAKGEITPQADLDTITLKYAQIACDCPQWVRLDKFNLVDSTGQERYESSYYIDPVSDEVELDEHFTSGWGNNTVRFLGKLTDTAGWPVKNGFMSANPPRGQVFTYYGYRVVFPAGVYGPPVHTGQPEIPGQEGELIQDAQISVREH